MASDTEDAGCSVPLQVQFEYHDYPHYTCEKNARCIFSLKPEERSMDRAPIDLCAVVDRSHLKRVRTV